MILNLNCEFSSVILCGIGYNTDKKECDANTYYQSVINPDYQNGEVIIGYYKPDEYFLYSEILSIGENSLHGTVIEKHSTSKDKYIFEGKRYFKKTMKITEKLEINYNRLTNRLTSYTNSINQDHWMIEFFNCRPN